MNRVLLIVAGVLLVAVIGIWAAYVLTQNDKPEAHETPQPTESVQPTETPTPTITETQSRQPSPTPTPTETDEPQPVLVPRQLLDGDCSRALPQDQWPAWMGDFQLSPYPGSLPLGTLGGLGCTWSGDTWVSVDALPIELAPADLTATFAQPACADSGLDGPICQVGRETENAWLLVSYGGFDEQQLHEVADVAASAFATSGPGIGVTPSPAWWSQVSCDELAARIDVAHVLGTDTYDFGYPGHGNVSSLDGVYEANNTSQRVCQWYAFVGDNELRTVRFWAYPGGAWDWTTQLEAASSPIAGGPAATVSPLPVSPDAQANTIVLPESPDVTRVLLNDGTNLLFAEMRSLLVTPDEVTNRIFEALRQ